MAPTEREHILVAVLFTDIVGSSELAAQMGDESWKRLLRRHHEIVARLVKEHGGRVVDTAGDGVFAVFERPARAIRCAFDAIESLRKIGVDIRAGLHFGETESSDGKVSGIVVHTASRVMALAGPGEVLITGTVRDLIAGKRIALTDRGTHDLRGIPSAWNVYAVDEVEGRHRPPPLDSDEAEELRHRTASAIHPSFPRRLTIVVVSLVVLIAGASILLGRDEPSGDGVRAGTPNLVRIDLETEQRSSATAGKTVTALTLGEGSVWLASHGDSAVYRLDPETMSVEARIPLREPPQELAAGEGSIWVTTSRDLVRIDPTSDTTEQTFSLGRCTNEFSEDECQTDVTVGDGTVWATHYLDRRIVEVDATTRTEVRRLRLQDYPMAVTTGHGALWVLLHGITSVIVQRTDLATRDVSFETLPPRAIEPGCFGYGRFASLGELCVAIEAGERSVWVATPGGFNSELWRLDPTTGDRVGDGLQLPCCVMAMSSSPELVPTIWVALSEDGVLTLGEISGQPDEYGDVGSYVTDLATGYDGLWIALDRRAPTAED